MKSLLLFILSLALTFGCAAQSHKKHGSSFDYNFQGGANFCQIDGDGSGNYNHIGFFAGVSTTYPIGDSDFRLSAGVNLSQKGSHVNTLNREITLTYYEVPIMLFYSTPSNAFRAGVGFAPSFLGKAKVKDGSMYNEAQSNNYKRMDPLPFRAEAQVLISRNMGIEAAFTTSLLNIAIENGSGTYRIFRSNKGQFNRTISAGLFYRF